MFTYTERLIAKRNLRPKKKQGFLKIISLFSFLGIMLGVAILIIVMSVMNGFRNDLTDKIIGLNPHIVLQFNNKNDLKFAKKEIIKNYKNFRLVETGSGEGIILSNGNAKGILIKGVGKKDHKQTFLNKKIIKGSISDLSTGKVMIGGELAYDLNLEIGDNISVISTSFIKTPFGSIPKQDNFIIAAIYNSGFYEFDQNLIYLDIFDTISMFDKQNLDLEIFLSDPFNAEKYKRELKKINKNTFIYSWSDLNKSLFSALKVERNVMFMILTLIIIVAAFNIISGLTILIKNKTKEIAIIKSLGLSDNSIIKSFFLTGFTIGCSASIAGVILGVIFSVFIEEIRNFMSVVLNINIFPSDIYYLDKMPSEINLISVVVIFTISLLITSLASYFPARSISKMKTINALKYE